jgi:hypothetical protein
LLFDATGNPLPNVLAQRRYQLTLSNEGEVSVDPDTLVAVVERTIDDVLETAGALATHIGALDGLRHRHVADARASLGY